MARYWQEMNYPQPTEEELQENAKNTRKKAAAKGQTLHPIVIKSRQIANSWWGKAWSAGKREEYAQKSGGKGADAAPNRDQIPSDCQQLVGQGMVSEPRTLC